jgi:peptidoglycan/LPS O-acetylase OafA/YrhL
MQYRKDIQILRGLSVLLVVLFHLEIASFKSGFLGVDVFFVISGYLMAVLYNPAKQMDFFIKRVKRLLPAYFITVILTSIACIALTVPSDYNQVATQAAFATGLSSNIGYWLENSYFDKSAFKPLLHLWSLGVEIHFYLCVPALYSLLKKSQKAYFILLISSLAACFFMVGISSKTSFFLMPLRFWEFLIGYGVAFYITKQGKVLKSSANWLGVISLIVLICIPLLKIDETKLDFIHGHPGIYAAIVCLATAVILAVGLPQKLESLTISTVLEKLGQYSYSIYLVHFPVIVLFLYKPFSGTILKTSDIGQKFILIAIISVLSLLFYHFVETPLRSFSKTPHLLLALALAVLAIAPLGMMIQKAIVPQQEMLIYQAWSDRSPARCPLNKRLTNLTAISCELTNNLEKPAHRILLVGNSHSDMIKTTFASVAQSKNVAVRFMVENNPLMPGGINVRELIDDALANQIDSLVLHYSPEAIDPQTIDRVVVMAREHNLPVSFILPVPVWQEPVTTTLLNYTKHDRPLPTMTLADYEGKNRQIVENMAKIATRERNFTIYSIADRFCHDTCEIIDKTGKPYYFDSGHLTLTGSEQLRPVFEEIISALNKI